MSLVLSGHRVVVIGGVGTIGKAVSLAFASAGASVVVADVERDKLDSVLTDLSGDDHQARAVDVQSLQSVEDLAQYCWDTGAINSVVYTPGVNYTGNVVDTDWAKYKHLMGVNLDGAFYTAKAFGSLMLASNLPGNLTFVASTAGKRGEAGASVYCATKFGLLGLVESFADEVAPQGIRVNAVCPGNVEGPLLTQLVESVSEREGTTAAQVLDSFVRASAAGRLVQPHEVASVCVWLASPEASAMMGASIVVDAATLSQ
jgi:NAD(P)-dependent dehydrogenase (short-subunit alcohol dehydrogenase family)